MCVTHTRTSTRTRGKLRVQITVHVFKLSSGTCTFVLHVLHVCVM